MSTTFSQQILDDRFLVVIIGEKKSNISSGFKLKPITVLGDQLEFNHFLICLPRACQSILGLAWPEHGGIPRTTIFRSLHTCCQAGPISIALGPLQFPGAAFATWIDLGPSLNGSFLITLAQAPTSSQTSFFSIF